MKWVSRLALLAAATAFAQDATVPDSSGYEYEERPGVGLYFELGGELKNVNYEYTIANKPFKLDWEQGPFFGVGAHLPITSWFGVNGVIAVQQVKFKYAMANHTPDDSLSCYMTDCDDYDSHLSDSLQGSPTMDKGLTSDDLYGKMNSRNLLVQAGFEVGYPVYSSYKNQLLIKPLVYGSGILGKTFFDDSKYMNANLWGYAYGGAVRLAWGPIALESGVRISHVYWRTYFDPADQTGEQAKEDTFLFDYDTALSPFFKAVWSLY